MNENRYLEFKESLTSTFLKTVSAFANYGSGEILFGVKNNGDIVGVTNASQICLDIENKINDAIKPSVNYAINLDKKTRLCHNKWLVFDEK